MEAMFFDELGQKCQFSKIITQQLIRLREGPKEVSVIQSDKVWKSVSQKKKICQFEKKKFLSVLHGFHFF